MTRQERECFEHSLLVYKHNWDLNSYYRTQYDEDLEYYLGYRDADEYPLSYNMSFPKLTPRVMVALSRFMEHLYQGGSHNLVSVRPRKRQDVSRAPRVEGLLNFQLEKLNDVDIHGGSFYFNFMWLFNMVTFGKGISKLYWHKEDRITPARMTLPVPIFDQLGRLAGTDTVQIPTETEQTVYDQPYAEVLHNKLCVPNPYYKSIQKMPAFFVVYRRSIDYLRSMEQCGIYKNVNLIGWNSGRGQIPGFNVIGEDSGEKFAKSIDIEGVMAIGDPDSDRVAPEVDVVEGYMKYIFPEDETAYEVGAGYKIKGKESEAIVHLGNYKTLLRIQKNTYGTRPFFSIGAYHHPELFWDLGFIRLGKAIQEQYNNLANTRYQNAIQMVNQMIKVRSDADIDPQALIWKPFGIIPVEDMEDVQPMMTPDVSQTGVFREQQEFFEDCLSDIIGVYPYNMGQTPPRQEHVGTIYSLQSMGEQRMKLLLMLADYVGFQPFLKYMMLLNMYHLPNKFETRIVTQNGDAFVPLFAEDIHTDYDFSVRYTSMEPALGKQFRAQQLIQLSGMWQQSQFLNQYNWMKTIMELMDIQNTDQYLYNPQQLAQMQAGQAQQAMQMQIMGAAMQDQMSARQSRRELQRDVVKGLLKS